MHPTLSAQDFPDELYHGTDLGSLGECGHVALTGRTKWNQWGLELVTSSEAENTWHGYTIASDDNPAFTSSWVLSQRKKCARLALSQHAHRALSIHSMVIPLLPPPLPASLIFCLPSLTDKTF